MAYTAKAVANFFLRKAKELGKNLTHLQIQKMVYFAHAVYFKNNHKPLIVDPVFAWKHGPVIQSLYDSFKHFGNSPITDFATELQMEDSGKIKSIIPMVDLNDTSVCNFLDVAYNELHKLPGWRLRCVSHAKNGAWYKTVSSKGINPEDESSLQKIPRNLVILDQDIETCGK